MFSANLYDPDRLRCTQSLWYNIMLMDLFFILQQESLSTVTLTQSASAEAKSMISHPLSYIFRRRLILKTLSFKLAVTTVLVMILIKILSVKKLPGPQVTMLSFLVYVLDWMIRMVISVLYM
jgi:hypothetical protein